jgi:hypothetical protein
MWSKISGPNGRDQYCQLELLSSPIRIEDPSAGCFDARVCTAKASEKGIAP